MDYFAWKKRQWEIAAKLMPLLLKRSGNRCHWCKCRIVSIRSIPKRDRIQQIRTRIVFRRNGTIQESAFATIDHLIPLRSGGDSRLTNLVPSCSECNYRRTKNADAPGDLVDREGE